MLYWLIPLAIYVVSLFMTWNYLRKAHNDGGVFYGADLDHRDFIFTVTPVVNTLVLIGLYANCGSPVKKQGISSRSFLRSFFMIKD